MGKKVATSRARCGAGVAVAAAALSPFTVAQNGFVATRSKPPSHFAIRRARRAMQLNLTVEEQASNCYQQSPKWSKNTPASELTPRSRKVLVSTLRFLDLRAPFYFRTAVTIRCKVPRALNGPFNLAIEFSRSNFNRS